ncbi:MAG: polysaccharide deacetylase family protein [Caldimonas sp.]
MAFLSKHRRVVSLSELVELARADRSPPAGTVCITFDDGYLDNLEVAAPVLARYRLPATLFLATGYVERGEAQWADALHSVWRRRREHRLSLPELGVAAVDLSSQEASAKVRELLHRVFIEARREERERWLLALREQLKPEGSMPRLTMRWADARALLERHPLFEIGGHTRDHIDLRRHGDDVAQREINGCADDLRRELSLEHGHFSFPYGRWRDGARELVIREGWRSAVGAGHEVRIGRGSDRFALPRVEAPRDMTAFRFVTSGAYPGALALLGLRP